MRTTAASSVLILLTMLLWAVLAAASCSTLPLDRAMSAEAGGDPTVVLCSSAGQCTRGYAFVQVRQTASQTGLILVRMPAVSCDRENCVRWQLIKRDGSWGLSGGIPKGQSELRLSVEDVSQVPGPVSPEVDGEYRILLDVFYRGTDGKEVQKKMHGIIRIDVLAADYAPVGCNDPVIAWETRLDAQGKCKAQWTTNLRGALCGACGTP